MGISRIKSNMSKGFKNLARSRDIKKKTAIVKAFFISSLIFFFTVAESQVRIRLFAGYNPENALLTVTSGFYSVLIAGDSVIVGGGTPVHISEYERKIAIKPYNLPGYLCDSVFIRPLSDDCSFSLRMLDGTQMIHHYTGSLSCYPELGSILLINTCDIEQYVAGVVVTEGGARQNPEYFKTQAVIARTYMYKYFHRHSSDGYNICDNTHCQAFNGISDDKAVLAAARATHNLVILDSDSVLIYSAFHSNCGGETCSSEDVWLTGLPYLKKVIDPYCRDSRNAKWQKSISIKTWHDYLIKAGFEQASETPATYDFVQNQRLTHYKAGSVIFPLQMIRRDFDLKSSFFSVKANGETITFDGRGYGHGVGLCQEGAMVMASRGFDFRQIISFYYSGVILDDISRAAEPEER
jgi:stage II sporulation protein D